MTQLMNLLTSGLSYSGSAATSRFAISRRLGIGSLLRLLGPLGAVLGAPLHASLDADRVERPTNHVIANAREVLDSAPPNEHERVLLQVVADARNVGRHLDAVGQAHARDLAERGVGLLRRLGKHPDADAPLLRTVLQRR